jgi:hypothetical protein
MNATYSNDCSGKVSTSLWRRSNVEVSNYGKRLIEIAS